MNGKANTEENAVGGIALPQADIPPSGRAIFLFVIWSKARKFENEIRARLATEFKILHECEVTWPRWDFTRRLWDFYGFGTRFMWWNKGRKCGRGPFKVYIVEDPHPTWRSHRDTSGRERLMDDGVYALKQRFRATTRHSNLIHSSVTPEETAAQLRVLFGCDPLPIVHALEDGSAKRIGIGQRRACYLLPGGETCLKVYRSDAEIDEGAHPERKETRPLRPTVIREIRSARCHGRRNTCCREYAYYRDLAGRLPKRLLDVFPERVEQVFVPGRGYGLIECVVRDADGSPSRSFASVYSGADAHLKKLLVGELNGLAAAFERYAVRFYDPQNVIVQMCTDGGFRLRIVDFEPDARTFFRPDAIFQMLVRLKVRRRFTRFRKQLGVKGHPLAALSRVVWDEVLAADGVKLGLSDCRAFLENKLVNDVFYEGTFKGRPCVIKCSSHAPYSICNEYEMLCRLFAVNPLVCAEPLAFWRSSDGKLAFVVLERLPGPTLTAARQDPARVAQLVDSIAADFERMAVALRETGIVHGDMGTTDNYLQGEDGHFRLIDFQFAVDRLAGCRDPWLRRHVKYRFAVLSCRLDGAGATWNDIAYLRDHLRNRLPVTAASASAADRLDARVAEGAYREPFGWKVLLILRFFAVSLFVQRIFRPNKGALHFRYKRVRVLLPWVKEAK